MSAHPLAAIDKTSRLRLRIFALKVVTIIPVSIALAVHRGYPIIGIVVVCCAWNSEPDPAYPQRWVGWLLRGMKTSSRGQA